MSDADFRSRFVQIIDLQGHVENLPGVAWLRVESSRRMSNRFLVSVIYLDANGEEQSVRLDMGKGDRGRGTFIGDIPGYEWDYVCDEAGKEIAIHNERAKNTLAQAAEEVTTYIMPLIAQDEREHQQEAHWHRWN